MSHSKWKSINGIESTLSGRVEWCEETIIVGVVGVLSGRKRNILAGWFKLWFLISVLPQICQ